MYDYGEVNLLTRLSRTTQAISGIFDYFSGLV